MGTGFDGTYVLTIDQTSLDGRPATTGTRPRIGQVWRRQGEVVRIDGPQNTLLLGQSIGQDALRMRVADAVQRRFELPEQACNMTLPDEPITDGFVISDGDTNYTLVPIETPGAFCSLLWCADGAPVSERDYKVIAVPTEPAQMRRTSDMDGDVICFTSGTRIRTQDGHKLVETLQAGDHVQTKDNGSQEILWIGSRRMTGARLHAMPDLRPIRIRADALQNGVPDGDLLVSPQHRMLYEGPNAQALFNAPEVLVSAQDMINDLSVFVDYGVREVTYVHVMFAEHQIIWANGIMTESFHPAGTTLSTIHHDQRGGLLELFPELDHDLYSYGPDVRRSLAKAEAAILLYDRL